ncbi:FeoA domain-containing protein [Clostridium perfringens]|nr:FeoA domain-containing protein [Clostridium perfringens]
MDTLEKKQVGEKLIVKGIQKDSIVKRRLLDMGITSGVTLEITGKAPLGDPIEVIVRGYKLTLRKNEAKSILV